MPGPYKFWVLAKQLVKYAQYHRQYKAYYGTGLDPLPNTTLDQTMWQMATEDAHQVMSEGTSSGGNILYSLVMGGAEAANVFYQAIVATDSDAAIAYAYTHASNDSLNEETNSQFSIIDWTGYPDGYPKPAGPFRLLDGEEYITARRLANQTNAILHKQNPTLDGFQIHEIHPIKFGGSPTDLSNKIPLSPSIHNEFNRYWYRIQLQVQSFNQ